MRRFVFLASLVAFVACRESRARHDAPAQATVARADSAQTTTCGTPVVTDSGIGELTIGRSVDLLRAHCMIVRDTTELREEGMPARVVSALFATDTVEAEVVDGRIWRVAIANPRHATADSLHVGTPLSRLLALRGVRAIGGEGALFVVSPVHCGLSFQLTDVGDVPADRLDLAGLQRLPASVTVSRILIVGCEKSVVGAMGRDRAHASRGVARMS